MAKLDKLLEQAKTHLDPGEEVLAAIQGTYETKLMGNDTVRTGILAATGTRVVFYAKKLGGYDLESFAYKNISSFEQSKGMMGHTVTFYASGNKVTMKWISDAAAMQDFVQTVKRQMHSAPAPPAPDQQAASSADEDIMDKIRKLGDLHQAGVLTDEEFSTKKAELLARL